MYYTILVLYVIDQSNNYRLIYDYDVMLCNAMLCYVVIVPWYTVCYVML